MRIARWAASTAAVAALLWPAAAAAQQRSIYAPSAAAEARPLSQVQRLERRFLQISAANLRFQADASHIVLKRSANPAIKDLAQTLLAREKTALPELLHLLQARGMALPIPANEHGKLLKQLGKANGAKLDRLYVDEVVLRSYQTDIGNYEKVAPQAEDPVLRAWIERQIPTLRFHVAKAGKALPPGKAPPPATAQRGQRAA
jgi:putative membrane protein